MGAAGGCRGDVVIMNVSDWRMRELRATRANPPALASEGGVRREIYGAALQQFEELHTAALTAGAATRPLLLFYALSQAGRAIVAALGDHPHVRSHGLREERGGDAKLLRRRLLRTPSKDGTDAFGAVARATGSGDVEEAVELGAVWAAIPAIHRLPPEERLRHRPIALAYQEPLGARGGNAFVGCELWSMSGPAVSSEDDVRRALRRYPTLPPSFRMTVRLGDGLDGAWVVTAQWESEDLNSVAPRVALTEERWLVPALAGQSAPLNPLMLWWLLLFHLSLVARYEPSLWSAALAVDRSSLSVPLEAVLGQAQDVLPALVYEPLSRT